MVGLVAFEPEGVIGPAMTLIYCAPYLNPKGLVEIATTLRINCEKQAGIIPKGLKGFCVYVNGLNHISGRPTPGEVVGTRFLKHITKTDETSSPYQTAMQNVVPNLMVVIQRHFKAAATESEDNRKVKAWLAGCLTAVFTPQQLISEVLIQKQITDMATKERQRLGTAITTLAATKKFTDQEIDALRTGPVLEEQATQIARLLNLSGDDREQLVRSKKLTDEQLTKLAEVKRFTEVDLNAFLKVGQIAMETFAHTNNVSSTLEMTGGYLHLFALDADPVTFGVDILGKIDTLFRAKYFSNADEVKRE